MIMNDETPTTKDSYELLIEKINLLEETIKEQNKKIADVTAMNRALLNSGSVPTASSEQPVSKEELRKKLIGGFKHGSFVPK